ncbi:ADP-glyceromanno-heptose 6-epimerase [Bacteriovoracaceae bacterium]|nr:ADP-glyceromanno-heptose 6-epimerase [Bacteriovoracaceae bacterium]
MTKICVTGGAGFIGSVLCRELNKLGHEDIIIVDRLRNGQKWLNLRGIKFAQYIHADEFEIELNDFKNGKKFEIDEIYHLGACSSTTETNVDFLYRNNFLYSKSLFEVARMNDIKIVYASSAATYGDGELGYSDSHKMIPSLLPLNPYGYSKQLFDEWALKQEKIPHFWAGLKFFNVFGPNEYHKEGMTSVVYKAFWQIKKTGKVKLFKSYKDKYLDGEQLRDFVYVLDVARAMIQMMTDQVESGVYNMGTGEARTFKDLVTATFSALNLKPNIEYIDMPENLKEQYQYYTKAEMGKFNKAIKDFSFGGLEESVKDYVQNYLEQKCSYH